MRTFLPTKLNKLSDIARFILLCIPFTLTTIGNAVIYLIVRWWRLIKLFFNKVKRYHFLLTFIRKQTKHLSSINSLFNLLRQPVNIPQLRLPRPHLPRIYIPPRLLWFSAGAVSVMLFVFLPFQAYQFLLSLPHPRLLSSRSLPVTTKIFDRNGNLLFEFFADQNRTPVDLDSIPLFVKQATIATEDKDFYHHLGISLRGIARASKEILLNKRLQGGSTITQQLIKNALLTPEPTVSRKVKEIILAFWAERLYTKDEILEMYFNQVPYGGTYWGIEAAAKGYFGKSVSHLNLAEATFLAGLPAAPTRYSPFGLYPELAKIRQSEVLNRMVEADFISKLQAEDVKSQTLSFVPQTLPIKAPHFVMYLKEVLVNRYGIRLVEQGGLRITTTLDLSIQEKAQEILASELEKVAHLRVGNGAMLVTAPQTGEILAMVGSKDYFDKEIEGNVNVTLSLRQPGSAIKVVTYAAALQNGYTAASILDDSPTSYRLPGGVYSPVNYDGVFHGRVPLRYALGNSYNVPAVKALERIGVATMVEQGKKMGIKSWHDSSRFGLSLTLGGGEVTMLDLATIYGTLANNGTRIDLTPIIRVETFKGDILEEIKEKNRYQAVAVEVAFILSDILSDNLARSWAFGVNSQLIIPGKTVAVKTGTSNDKRDNWTIGYTPSYVVAVWVGNNDNSPMNPVLTSGITGATPIWNKIMTDLLKDKEDEKFTRPKNVIAVPCFFGRLEYFISGAEPKGGCPKLSPPITPSPSPQ